MSIENSYYSTAKKLYNAENYKEATVAFGSAIQQDPTNADLYSERGVTWFHLGNLPAALADMNKSQELEPKNPYRYSSRAYIRDAMGDTRGAIEDYKLAIKLDPEDAIAHNNLGLLEEKLGYKEQAKNRFTTADHLAQQQGLFTQHPSPPEAAPTGSSAASEPTLSGEIKKVFTTKKGFREFIAFLKNGFK